MAALLVLIDVLRDRMHRNGGLEPALRHFDNCCHRKV